MRGISWKESSLSSKVTTSGEAITGSLVNIRLIPSGEGGEAVDITSDGGGEAGSTEGGNFFSTVRIYTYKFSSEASSESSHKSPFQLGGSILSQSMSLLK